MLSTRSAWLSPSRPCAASARARARSSPTRCSSGRVGGQDAQRGAEPAGGAGGGAQQRRHPGLREHGDRLRVALARGELDVVRPRRRRRAARGEALRRARVRAEQPAAGRALVDRAADERVPEAEAPRDVGGADEADVEQLVERVHRGRLLDAGRGDGDVGLERVAGDGRAAQHAAAAASGSRPSSSASEASDRAGHADAPRAPHRRAARPRSAPSARASCSR